MYNKPMLDFHQEGYEVYVPAQQLSVENMIQIYLYVFWEFRVLRVKN